MCGIDARAAAVDDDRMTRTLNEMSETAAEVLQSLTDFPSRSTASGIANGPSLVRWMSPGAAQEALWELAALGLAVQRSGRWSRA
jgi:hypothetical protein